MSNLPFHDAALDIESLNIFRPIESILPYNLPKIKIDQAPTTSTNQANDSYCKACKKKFNNEATFKSHLKSAKHIANEKKLGGSFKSPASTQKIAVNPQVQNALQQLEQAKAAADPNTAVSIYWTQSQALFGLKRSHYVETALTSLISSLDRPGLSFTSAQTTSFRYTSQLALSRLLCIYQQLDASRTQYLQALESKWKIDTSELLALAKHIRTTPVASLLASCDTLATKYLTRERNRTKPAPPISDPNNMFTVILNEAAGLFAQEQQTFNHVPCEHIAIVLYGICSFVCPFEKQGKPEDAYFLMSQLYTSLPDLTHRVIELKLLDSQNTWNVFDAMLSCLETDDVVLANKIQQQIPNQGQPDIAFLCNVLKKKMTFTEDVDLYQDFKYIQLLSSQSMTDTLFIGNQSSKVQALTLDRFEQLIMIS